MSGYGEWQPKGFGMILVCIIALIVIYQIGPIIAEFTRWLTTLFHIARIDIRDARGFGAFVQLIMLAVFVGWAYNRFRR